MSQRSIRRAQQRRLAADRRREALRRRRGSLAAGAAIGATALFAPSAQAANFEVNSLADAAPVPCTTAPGGCTLRDAITDANANSEADTITFQSGLTGTITLTQGQLPISATDLLTIDGPGAGVLSVSGDADSSGTHNTGDSRIFFLTGPASISGLTLTGGYSSGASGGAILEDSTARSLTIADSKITGSQATGSGSGSGSSGGGIYAEAPLTITGSEVTGNQATNGGGIHFFSGSGSGLTISHTKISGNSATAAGGLSVAGRVALDHTEISGNDAAARGGGLLSSYFSVTSVTDSKVSGNHVTGPTGTGGGIEDNGPLTLQNTEISGNTTTLDGGGISQSGKYAPLEVIDSLVSGNSAGAGGGISFAPTVSGKYGSSPVASKITGTTISGNHATDYGAGIRVATLNDGDHLTVTRSTISGNDGGPASHGGGIMFGGPRTTQPIRGAFDLVDSTISGNTADSGAGVSVGDAAGTPVLCSCGSIGFDNSTIAANAATTRGGGLYLAQYDSSSSPPVKTSATVALTSTLVGDNTAAGAAQDLDRIDTSTGGGFDLAYSLVEAPGDAPLTESPSGTNIIGSDPQLGALADNGGPTRTQLPAPTSPAIDKGNAPARLIVDQRAQPRTVDGDPPNAHGADGTDIGAVEISNPPKNPPVVPPVVPPPPPAPDARPLALIKKNDLRARKDSKRRATGVASDDHKVARVQVAIVSKHGGKCRELLPSGQFSVARRCRTPRSFLPARGTKKWSFTLAHRLPPGYYVLYARAIDNAGQTQISFGTKSRRPFRVR